MTSRSTRCWVPHLRWQPETSKAGIFCAVAGGHENRAVGCDCRIRCRVDVLRDAGAHHRSHRGPHHSRHLRSGVQCCHAGVRRHPDDLAPGRWPSGRLSEQGSPAACTTVHRVCGPRRNLDCSMVFRDVGRRGGHGMHRKMCQRRAKRYLPFQLTVTPVTTPRGCGCQRATVSVRRRNSADSENPTTTSPRVAPPSRRPVQ